MTEWRAIIEHPDYEVSELGDVRNAKTGRVLKQFVGTRGGLMLTIDHVSVYAHRLVAEAFIPNDDPNYWTDVIHIDGDKQNNDVDNLKWGTHSEALRGMSGKEVLLIDEDITFDSVTSAAEYLGVSRDHLRYCLSERNGHCNGMHLCYV